MSKREKRLKDFLRAQKWYLDRSRRKKSEPTAEASHSSEPDDRDDLSAEPSMSSAPNARNELENDVVMTMYLSQAQFNLIRGNLPTRTSKREKRQRDFLRARQWFLGRSRRKKSEPTAEASVSSEGAIAEDDDDNDDDIDDDAPSALPRGPTYDEATACRILREEVLVLASRSDNGEAVVGFDPDDAALDNLYFVRNEYCNKWWMITPMIYYIYKKKLLWKRIYHKLHYSIH